MDLQVERCEFLPYAIFLAYDENGDGSLEATLDLFDDGTFNENTGVGIVVPTWDPNTGIWTINIPAAAVGDHTIFLQPFTECGPGFENQVNVSVVECDFFFVCQDGIIADLLSIDPPADVDGDGDLDVAGIEITPDMLLLLGPDGCTPPAALSINLVGQTPNINQSSLWLTCDLLGNAPVEIHVWDETGNSDFCETILKLR